MEKMIKNKTVFHTISAIISFAFTMILFRFFKITFQFQEVVFLTAMFGIAVLVELAVKITDKRLMIASGVFSVLLSLSFVIGRKIHLHSQCCFDYFSYTDVLYLILLSSFFFIVVLNILNFVGKQTIEYLPKRISFKFWAIAFGIIAVAWLPYLFIYYPGNLASDSYITIYQSLGVLPFSNHHPIMFTLFVKIFIKFGLLFGDISFSVACFSFAQLLIMAAILSYCVYWFAQKGVPKPIIVLVTVYFALNPVFARYSITMMKDILFGGWMLLFILFLYDIIESKGMLLIQPKGLVGIVICSFLVSFARNNGTYVVFAMLIVLGIYFRKQYKRLVPVFLATIIAIAAIQGPLYKALNISKSGFAESVGIPLQQIGYTLKYNGNVSDEQKDFLNQIMPVETIKEVYKPATSDKIKFNPAFNNQFLEQHKGQFIKVWAEMLPANFIKYVKAYFLQTVGYWHMGTTDWIVCNNYLEGLSIGIESTDYIQKITNVGFQSKVDTLIDKLASAPLVENIYSISFMVWLTFFYCIVMIVNKRPKNIIPIAPLLALWATMMIATPIFCEFRYMFSFHLATPFLLITMFRVKSQVPDQNVLVDCPEFGFMSKDWAKSEK